MNCREKQYGAPVRPRRTEEVARETVAGLVVEMLALRGSDEPMAWERLAAIGREITDIGTTTAREFRRRRMAQAIDIQVSGDFVLVIR